MHSIEQDERPCAGCGHPLNEHEDVSADLREPQTWVCHGAQSHAEPLCLCARPVFSQLAARS